MSNNWGYMKSELTIMAMNKLFKLFYIYNRLFHVTLFEI